MDSMFLTTALQFLFPVPATRTNFMNNSVRYSNQPEFDNTNLLIH